MVLNTQYSEFIFRVLAGKDGPKGHRQDSVCRMPEDVSLYGEAL